MAILLGYKVGGSPLNACGGYVSSTAGKSMNLCSVGSGSDC